MIAVSLDVGGANVKAALASGVALTRPFALWRNPGGLTGVIAELLRALPAADVLAVTMTGELCDAFASRAEGVRRILGAVCEASGLVRAAPIRVWTLDGVLVDVAEALERPQAVAAANWLALARWAAPLWPDGDGLVIDVGSTTTDILALRRGAPLVSGITDTERLLSGELAYSGVGRTPVHALVRTLPYRGAACPVAAEYFASTLDAYIALGDLPEAPDFHATADGRPATREHARARLARMLCAEAADFSDRDLHDAAAAIAESQLALLRDAVARVAARHELRAVTALVSGAGEFLAERLCAVGPAPRSRVVRLSTLVCPAASQAAPAFALACIASTGCEKRSWKLTTREI